MNIHCHVKEFKSELEWKNQIDQIWNDNIDEENNTNDQIKYKFSHYLINNYNFQDGNYFSPFTCGKYNHFWINENTLNEYSLNILKNLLNDIPIQVRTNNITEYNEFKISIETWFYIYKRETKDLIK